MTRPAAADPDDAPIILPRRQVSQWFGFAAVALVSAWIVYQLLINPGFQWDIVGRYMLNPLVLQGVVTTIELTAAVMAVATAIGIVIALMRLSGGRVLPLCAYAFTWFFRGVPVLVQLVFWYNLAALFPTIAFGIPFGGPKLYEVSSTEAISSFLAALLGFGLNEAAYMAEIVRAGLLSVDPGQTEAARALGYRPGQTFRAMILPQAMRAIVPPTGNQVIGMLKFTSLASVVALSELMNSVENIYTRTFETVPLLIVAALWYLVLVSALSVLQLFIERHYGRGGDDAGRGMTGPFVRVADVWKQRGRTPVLKGVRLEAARGEVACLLGPSGAGKSTLLRCINALETAGPRRWSMSTACRSAARRGTAAITGCAERALSRQRAGDRHGVPELQPVPAHVGARERHRRADPGPQANRAAPPGAGRLALLEQVGLADKAGGVSAPALRRAAAAGRDRAGAGDAAQADAVRRADLGARPASGRRGAGRDQARSRPRG